jgi:hypothetical protein
VCIDAVEVQLINLEHLVMVEVGDQEAVVEED